MSLIHTPAVELICPQPGKCENCGETKEIKFYKLSTLFGRGAVGAYVQWCEECCFIAIGYIASTWGQEMEIKRPAPTPEKRKRKHS